MTAFLGAFVGDFARALAEVDKECPVAGKAGREYGAGIGPHDERPTVKMVMDRLTADGLYSGTAEVPYGGGQRCDIGLGSPPKWDWAIEVKVLRAKRANGDPDHENIGHILSPYSNGGSALADCQKLAGFGFAVHKAILIVGYDYDEWPMLAAVEAFEMLARARVSLGKRHFAAVSGLIHKFHNRGGVFAWEVFDNA